MTAMSRPPMLKRVQPPTAVQAPTATPAPIPTRAVQRPPDGPLGRREPHKIDSQNPVGPRETCGGQLHCGANRLRTGTGTPSDRRAVPIGVYFRWAWNHVHDMRSPEVSSAADKSDFRQRLLDALEASIAEDGYARTTVADIVRRAKTSRRTFYEYFDSREACFVVLLSDANADQIRQISDAVDPTAPWQKQVRQAVEAWISSGEARPALMVSWIRDVHALGASARGLQRDAMEHFIEMVSALGDTDEFRAAGIGPVSRQRIIMLLGGLRELTAITVEEGGRMSDVTDEAVDASIALLSPRRG